MRSLSVNSFLKFQGIFILKLFPFWENTSPIKTHNISRISPCKSLSNLSQMRDFTSQGYESLKNLLKENAFFYIAKGYFDKDNNYRLRQSGAVSECFTFFCVLEAAFSRAH